ncbi:MAG: transcription termination/antitermination protein NusG [Limnochordaceae bacterium]|nr:transcription termination/antitermination protein NusG [Limnochordaceae bacterium]
MGEEPLEAVRFDPTPSHPDSRWYVIHTYSGYENKVKANLERRVRSMGMDDKIFRVLVPTEEEIDFQGGKKRIIKRKIFPGYVLVEMIMSDDSWYVVRHTPGVTGFVSPGARPVPLEEYELRAIMKQMGLDEERKPRVAFDLGDPVRVISGPFVNFTGKIDGINVEKGKLRVIVSMFGRETPVELDFEQVEKV